MEGGSLVRVRPGPFFSFFFLAIFFFFGSPAAIRSTLYNGIVVQCSIVYDCLVGSGLFLWFASYSRSQARAAAISQRTGWRITWNEPVDLASGGGSRLGRAREAWREYTREDSDGENERGEGYAGRRHAAADRAKSAVLDTHMLRPGVLL